MMKIINIFYFFFLFLIGAVFFSLISCRQSGESGATISMANGGLSGSDKNVKIPKELIEQIESEYLKEMKKGNPSESEVKDAAVLANIPRRLLELKVTLTSSQPGVLKNDVQFFIGRSGGTIDLAEWITDVRGDFNFTVQATMLKNMEANKLKVYFISRAPKRTIEGEKWGMGCGKYADISSFYQKTLSRLGWRLNSTSHRYYHALIGNYLFFYVFAEELYFNSLTLMDSRLDHQNCYDSP